MGGGGDEVSGWVNLFGVVCATGWVWAGLERGRRAAGTVLAEVFGGSCVGGSKGGGVFVRLWGGRVSYAGPSGVSDGRGVGEGH